MKKDSAFYYVFVFIQPLHQTLPQVANCFIITALAIERYIFICRPAASMDPAVMKKRNWVQNIATCAIPLVALMPIAESFCVVSEN